MTSVDEMSFADVGAETRDRHGESTPRTGRASTGVGLLVRDIPKSLDLALY